MWKKLQDGLMLQPQGKNRRQAAMKRISKTAAAETGMRELLTFVTPSLNYNNRYWVYI